MVSKNPSRRGSIEALAVVRTPTALLVATRFRSMNPGEGPNLIRAQLIQTTAGTVLVKVFSNPVKTVKAGSTVAEGVFELPLAELKAVASRLGLRSVTGLKIGLYAKWPSGHDQNYHENAAYQFTVP